MRFRPCIDLHGAKVKQIVGKTLRSDRAPQTNFETDASSASFAQMFRRDGLAGGHVIMLGPGNEEAARAALAAFPGGLQIGGGISPRGTSPSRGVPFRSRTSRMKRGITRVPPLG